MGKQRIAVVLGALAAVVLPLACGSRQSFFTGTDGGDAGLDATYDSSFALADSFAEVGSACRACSTDRHTVLDCDGGVVEQCTGPNGCDEQTGTCVNACQVAMARKQSVGCEYYATFLDMFVQLVFDSGRCFAAFVANTWNTPAHIQIDRGPQSYDPTVYAWIPQGVGNAITYKPYTSSGLPPGQVAIVFLGGGTGSPPLCPSASAGGTAPMVIGTGRGQSFRIRTDVPTVAYEMNPYGGGSAMITGASLLLPTSAWDLNYVANTAAPQGAGSPSIAVIASEDNTQVTLLPKVAVTGGGGLPAGAANTPVQFTLHRGEFAQFEQSDDLAGSILSSTKPIGVMSASPCMDWPRNWDFCDHGEQMLPPVGALGSEYVAVMFRPRVPGDVAGWRLGGAVDGTTLSYVPAAPPGAPSSLAQGQVVEFETDQPFVVKSQDDKHPFLTFTYMSGSGGDSTLPNDPGNNGGYGDPDHVVDVPPAQYLSDYVFFTDPTFPETNLVVVRKPIAPQTFADVELDCAGTLGGWQPVGDYEWTRVDLETGDFQGVGGCSNGRHEIRSAAPFGLWVWGWGSPNTSTETRWVSYGYPGGMNVQTINTVIVPSTPK